MLGVVPRLQAQVVALPVVSNNPRLKGLLEHPAGPFTIHFWAPTAKWLISIANIMDINRPVENISLPQQTAVTATGLIWSRYATQITPVNYNLLSVNFVMATTGIYHLSRIIRFELEKREAAAAAAAAAGAAGAAGAIAPPKGK